MKTLGRTNGNGGYIVELKHDEYEALNKLVDSLGGHPGFLGETAELDISTALRAIKTYSTYRRIIQDMNETAQSLLRRLEYPEDDI